MLAFASPIQASVMSENIVKSKATGYVLLLDPHCDEEKRAEIERLMRLNNTVYEKYIGNYQVLCFGGWHNGNIWVLEEITTPLLRVFFPDDVFVYVYSEDMKVDFSKYLG